MPYQPKKSGKPSTDPNKLPGGTGVVPPTSSTKYAQPSLDEMFGKWPGEESDEVIKSTTDKLAERYVIVQVS